MKGREERKRIEPLITRIRRIRGEILDFELKTSRKDAKEGASIHGHLTLRLGDFARDFFLKMEKRGFW